MASLSFSVVSENERAYILGGVAADMRADGRSRSDYRAFNIETGVITNCNGSARIKLDLTDVLVRSEGFIPLYFFLLWMDTHFMKVAVKAEVAQSPLNTVPCGKVLVMRVRMLGSLLFTILFPAVCGGVQRQCIAHV